MVGWYHQLDGHEFEQAPGVGDGQESLSCCSPWSVKELDMTEQLNNNSIDKVNDKTHMLISVYAKTELKPTRLLCPWDSPGKSTGVGGHALLQGIFPTQRPNPGL